MNEVLLSLEEIAAMRRCSVRHARDHIVNAPGFPMEAPSSTPRSRVWIRKEVVSYFTRRPASIPHNELKAS